MHKCKHFFILMIVFAMLVPLAAKKVKTGECKDNHYRDLRYGMTLEIPDNWKTKTFKEKEDKIKTFRALFVQKNYEVNLEARELGGDYTIPEIQVYVRPDTKTPAEFVDSLKAATMTHDSTDDIINQMNLVLSGQYVAAQEIEMAGVQVHQAYFKREWKREMQGDAADPRYSHYGGLVMRPVHDVHEVYVCSKDGNLYVIQAFAENEFYPRVQDEFARIISSLGFGNEPENTEDDK